MYSRWVRRGTQVNKNLSSKKPMKYKFHIPSKKLPSSLAKKICSPLWKSIIHSIETGNVKTVQTLVKSIDKKQEAICLPHPFLEDLDTFVTKNMRQGMCNFISSAIQTTKINGSYVNAHHLLMQSLQNHMQANTSLLLMMMQF